jgi:hypothetical protein
LQYESTAITSDAADQSSSDSRVEAVDDASLEDRNTDIVDDPEREGHADYENGYDSWPGAIEEDVRITEQDVINACKRLYERCLLWFEFEDHLLDSQSPGAEQAELFELEADD